jgi:hypothetical protein
MSFSMGKDQPVVADVVVSFPAQSHFAVYLSALDRLDVAAWREPARKAGYDRMVIYERECGDDAAFGDFLCLHRRGEAWSHWGFARRGCVISVWCCLTGADIGDFSSMSGAFEAVLTGVTIKGERRSGMILDLMPRLRQAADRLGSAA